MSTIVDFSLFEYILIISKPKKYYSGVAIEENIEHISSSSSAVCFPIMGNSKSVSLVHFYLLLLFQFLFVLSYLCVFYQNSLYFRTGLLPQKAMQLITVQVNAVFHLTVI